jgi:hypothetical protein
MDRRIGITVVVAALLALAACQTQPTLTEETSPDGLVKVKNSYFQLAWVRPGVDLSGYDKIMLEGVGIEYRPARVATNAMQAQVRGQTEFGLTEDQKARLKEIVRKAFVSELGKSKSFTLVEQPGPGTLRIRGALLDVVSFVPPDPVGNSRIYLRDVGEATLMFEVRDAQSEQIFARAADRRAVEKNIPQQSNSVTNGYDVEQAARQWAIVLRQRLDAVKELHVAAAAKPAA